jgi:D-alanyl-D-alanine dipeptidase
MTDASAIDRLLDLRRKLGALPHHSLREAFERGIDPAQGVEYRHLFASGASTEQLVEIPLAEFARIDPHPYAELGAPYDGHSPFHLRQSVLPRLQLAQNVLRAQRPGWSIRVFDAWRPLAVQRYMVEHEYARLKQLRGLSGRELDAQTEAQLWQEVFGLWARPDEDMAAPPPHTTGAAIDITLLDEHGTELDMGSAIDDFGGAALPGYFADSADVGEQKAHANRQLLASVMAMSGFARHPYEWWHFSFGDQMWALMCWLDEPMVYQTPLYGRLT